MSVKTTTFTSTTTTQEISAKDLRSALNVPDNARLFVTVPSGGDYSSMELDIDELDEGLQVSWTETKQS